MKDMTGLTTLNCSVVCVEFHECGGEVLLGDRVGHEADEEGRGPVLHRRVYHIEDLYDLKSKKRQYKYCDKYSTLSPRYRVYFYVYCRVVPVIRSQFLWSNLLTVTHEIYSDI